jgi:galactosamine-6-phosphate isomerase
MNDPNSCQAYLDQHLIKPLAITTDRYIAFNSEATAPAQECQRIQTLLNQFAPLDLCVLGLGKNGHLGFNEPTLFSSHCHVANLSPQTLQHAMALAMHPRPTLGMTLGMADILSARKILLLITGAGKQVTITKFLKRKVSRQLPASFLWLHPQVECLLDKSSC